MTKAKPTGGVWEARTDPDDEFGCDIEIITEGSAPIAQVLGADNFPCLDEDTDFGALHTEKVATARVMAASKDMLAACESSLSLINVFLRVIHRRDLNENLADDVNETVAALEAAIYKATGSHP